MDAFLNRLEALARLAAREPDLPPPDAAGLMARIRGLEPERDDDFFPLRLFLGGTAAALALAASIIVSTAWADDTASVSFSAMITLASAMDILL
ncbi:MAG: hypothetical protein LBE84_10460 [Planctomycetota bacterium]|jgi:hypothetical protein|nr:hypothetical protein [Planctomycetota bacterium]